MKIPSTTQALYSYLLGRKRPTGWHLWHLSAPIVLPLGFFVFGEGRELGGGGDEGEVKGLAVCSALSRLCLLPNLSSARTWGTLTSGLMSDWISDLILPRRVASSSGIGEVTHSPSTGCRREASTISSLLRANMGAMQFPCCITKDSSGATRLLNMGCSSLAKARDLCSLITLKLEEGGEGMYCSSQSWRMAGGGAYHSVVSCWARGSCKVAACH